MSSPIRVEAKPADAGGRVDIFLARCAEGFSRSALARLCGEGRVLLIPNKKKDPSLPVGKSFRVSAGDVFEIAVPPPAPDKAVPQDIQLSVVYEDGDILVVDKPRGLVVHPAAGHPDGTLVNALLHHCAGSLSGVGGVHRPGIVHRLDKDTSGLLVAAKHDAAHRSLAGQLANHAMSRVYEALVKGAPRAGSGVVDRPVGRDPKNRKRMAVVDAGGKQAVTHYTVLARFRETAHVECRLETGRTHQIRAHMRWLGHPLLGDKLYGGPDNWGLGGQCLHARELVLNHPVTGERMTFSAMRPEYFTAVLDALRE